MVRREIARTRVELGETAAALAAKTDVKGRVSRAAAEKTAQVKHAIGEKAADVKEKAAEVKNAATEKAAEVKSTATEKTAEIKQVTADNTVVARRSLPLPLIGAAALALAGIVLVRRGRRS